MIRKGELKMADYRIEADTDLLQLLRFWIQACVDISPSSLSRFLSSSCLTPLIVHLYFLSTFTEVLIDSVFELWRVVVHPVDELRVVPIHLNAVRFETFAKQIWVELVALASVNFRMLDCACYIRHNRSPYPYFDCLSDEFSKAFFLMLPYINIF